MKKCLALSPSDDVFIMLINVKMPTIVGILIFMSRINFVHIYEQDKFRAQVSSSWKKFKNSGPMLIESSLKHCCCIQRCILSVFVVVVFFLFFFFHVSISQDKPHSHCAGVATVHPDAGQPVYRDAPGHIS